MFNEKNLLDIVSSGLVSKPSNELKESKFMEMN